jgi:hypothetical protein
VPIRLGILEVEAQSVPRGPRAGEAPERRHDRRPAGRPGTPARSDERDRNRGPGQSGCRGSCTPAEPGPGTVRRGARPCRRTRAGGRRTPWRRSRRAASAPSCHFASTYATRRFLRRPSSVA